MSFDNETEDLFDDGFEGSINEHKIFTEVFFGKDQIKTNKKCLVTGAISFASNKSKPKDMLPSLDNESQSNTSNINLSLNKHASSTRDDITGGKHMKLSTDEQSVFNSVTCRLVESIKQGIISSSYLLKGRVSMHSLPGFHENVDKVISTSKATLSTVSQESLHENDEKELSARKAIPSPVSHESTHANDGEKYSAGEPIPSTVSQERSHENNEEVISASKAIPSLVPQDESKTLSKAITSPVSQERFHESDEQMISASKAIPSLVCQEYFNESDENKKILSKASPLPVSQERFHEINEQIISAGKAIPPPASQESSHENCEKKTSASFKAIPALVSQESVHDNDEKRISTSTLITSSIYQESSATQSPTLITRGEKTMISKVDNLSKDKVLPYKDPRPLLRTYIQNLLTASGWEITKRIRPGKVNGGYIYKSPQIKKLLREFTKVWDLLGQSLSIDRNLLVSEDGKQWSDMTSFWSDLSLTLTKFDEESSLAKRWCLLDPFVNLVLIEKKLGLLKAGKEVKAQSTLHGNEGAAIPSKSSNRTGIKSKRGYSNGVCKSSLTGESLLTNIEAMSSVSKDICGTSITADFERKSNETVNDQNSLCDEKCTYSQNSHGLKSNGLQLRNLDNNSVHSSSCLNEAPFTSQNVRGLFSESVSPRKEGNPSSHVNSVCVSNYGVDPELVRGNINMSTPQAKSGNKRKRSKACEVEDDKLLLSPVVRNKKSRYSAKKSTRKTKPCRPKTMRKCNTKRGSCRLLRRSLSKGDKQEKKWYLSSPRTVLSWLINSRHVSLKEVIACQDSTDNTVVKEGLITKDGILCNCCDNVISVSEFKSHAGFGLHHPCLNLVMGSGKDYKFCELEAWADEYRTRKSATRPVEVEDLDQNDDSCGLCGNGGELICCENCPSTFHQKCLCEQEFPEGDWYCQYCSCGICGKLVNDKEDLMSNAAFKCSQCEHKYHEACMKEKVASQELASEAWLCGKNCQEVYLGLQSRLGLLNNLSDGISWTLLRCTHEDQKVHFAQTFIDLKAERNLKLAVALTIMEECFQSMVDARTGIDMIPHVLYNLESEFARLNCHGFYTMVLEKDDVLISVASIRIHGVTVAEMPLIATCSKYRRQGMCRRLMDSIEEMLLSFKVEKLVITAIPDVVETWTVGFGFEPLEDHERKSLSHFNLMVFPGSVWLKKTLYSNQATDKQMTEMECCSGEVLTIARPRIVESGQREEDMREERNNHVQEDSGKILSEELALIDGKILPQMIGDGVSVDMNSEIELPKVSCGEKPTSKIGESQLETTLNVDSLAMDDARILAKTHYEKQPILDQGECGS